MPRGRKKKVKLKLNLKPGVTRSVFAVILFLVSLLSLISFFAPNYSLNSKILNLITGMFGWAGILVPFIIAIGGMFLLDSIKSRLKEPQVFISLVLLLFSLSSFFHLFISKKMALEVANDGRGGGLVGYKISSILINSISIYGAFLLLAAALVICIVILFEIPLDKVFATIIERFSGLSIGSFISKFKKESQGAEGSFEEPSAQNMDDFETPDKTYEPDVLPINTKPVIEVISPVYEPSPEPMGMPGVDTVMSIGAGQSVRPNIPDTNKIWQTPPLDILIDPPVEVNSEEDKSKTIKETMKAFDVDVDVVEVKTGASVTQYSLKPKSVARVNKIVSLQENLALALASSTGSVRIEAPIPGKSLIGIEVPNTRRTTVYFKPLITSESMRSMKSKVAITLGKDVAGDNYVYDIAKMPHLLIAGTTGSGKSIFIHNILFSILFRASPQEVKLILVDPKRVELSNYAGIPHLITPVVTDVEKAPSVFKWAVKEMEHRYKLLEQAKVRNIDAYNEKSGFQAMPFIVIIVDELAEIMLQDPTGIEKSINRIAQLSRAVGIHLVLAVQRPSTNIITGSIKANFPTRVSFNVPSQIDSRVIIDQPGAEKLLGKGDMLFIPPDSPKPVRLQSAWVSDREVANLVNFLKAQGIDPDYNNEILTMEPDKSVKGSGEYGDDVDELFEEAVDIVKTAGKASASLLQRKLSIGYARAARIIDQMAERNVIAQSALSAGKGREILMDTPTFPEPAQEEDFIDDMNMKRNF